MMSIRGRRPHVGTTSEGPHSRGHLCTARHPSLRWRCQGNKTLRSLRAARVAVERACDRVNLKRAIADLQWRIASVIDARGGNVLD